MLLSFVLAIFLVFPVTEAVDGKYTALQFGTTTSDYISFNHDMTPFRTSLTLCSWVKRVYTSSSYPTVFHYWASSNTYEILITSNGIYNRVAGDSVLDYLPSKFTTPAGQWFHYCLTWSSSSRTMQLYLDGELAASDQTSGRQLYTSGTVWFNRFGNSVSNGFVFGGQLYRFNMYTEVLSSETIKRIADGGLCAEAEETISSRQLRWEDVLAKSRSGSVVEVTECDVIPTKQLKAMREQLAAVTSKLNATEGDLETVTGKFNSTKDELQNVTDRLNRTEDELGSCLSILNDLILVPVLACTTGILMVVSIALGLLFCCERRKGKKEDKGLGKVAYNASSGVHLGEEEGSSPSADDTSDNIYENYET